LAYVVAAVLVFLGICICIAVVLMVAATFVLALGARTWSDATASAARARAHLVQADSEEIIAREAITAVDKTEQEQQTRRARADWKPPTDEELLQTVLVERAIAAGANGRVHNDEEITTDRNAGVEPERNAFDGRMYREPTE